MYILRICSLARQVVRSSPGVHDLAGISFFGNGLRYSINSVPFWESCTGISLSNLFKKPVVV